MELIAQDDFITNLKLSSTVKNITLLKKKTSFSRIFLIKFSVAQMVKKFTIFLEAKVHYRVHRSSPLDPILASSIHKLAVLCYSMGQSPSGETNSNSAGRGLHQLRNPKVHYRIHKDTPLDPVLGDFSPHPYILFKIHFNIIPHLRLCRYDMV
jgi:hypothetical protein